MAKGKLLIQPRRRNGWSERVDLNAAEGLLGEALEPGVGRPTYFFSPRRHDVNWFQAG